MSQQAMLVSTVVYAVLLIVGGVIGYLKAGSRASLIAGVGSGAGAFLAAAAAWMGHSFGLPLALGLSAALVVVFAIRLKKTGKFMPAGLLLCLSGLMVGLLSFGLLGTTSGQ